MCSFNTQMMSSRQYADSVGLGGSSASSSAASSFDPLGGYSAPSASGSLVTSNKTAGVSLYNPYAGYASGSLVMEGGLNAMPKQLEIARRAEEIMSSDLFASAVSEMQSSATTKRKGLFSDEWSI